MSGAAEIAATGPLLLALGLCVLAGLVSFASPCVVPLVPGYLSYLAAVVGVEDRVAAGAAPAAPHAALPVRVVGSALLFVAGFTAVFLLGHRRGARHDHLADHQSGCAATGRRRADHHHGAGVRRLHPGAAAPGPVHPAACCRRWRVPRCSARCSRWAGRRAWGPTLTGVITVASATDGASVARGVVLVIAYCLGLGIPFVLLAFGSAWAVGGLGWLRTAHPRHPDLRRRPAHPGRARAGHRRVERLRLLGARRVRQRREAADLSTASDSRADAESHSTGPSCESASARADAQHLAGADLDGHRAGAAVPAGAGRGARRAAAAAQPQREQGRRVHRAAIR